MIVQNVTTGACTPQTIVIGRRGTYDTMQIAFDLSYLIESYGSGTAVLAVKRSQDESAYPAVVTQEDSTLLWTVNETDTAYVGSGECQLMWYVDGGLAKTIIYPMVVMRDILSTAEEPPDGYENWIEHLTELGAETQQNAQNAAQSASDASTAKDDAVTAKEAAEAAQEAAEEAQEKAEIAVSHYPVIVNGYWNVWSVEAQTYVSTGIKAVGEDGYSPEVTITAITGGHRVTITDKDHPQGQSFDVMDGQGGGGGNVNDVLVNNTSVLVDGIANVPAASANTYGVVKTGEFYGTKIVSGKLTINTASPGDIKEGETNYRPIAPLFADYAAFYGLARAAGDTSQALSPNTVGNYTDNAKTAIKNMLGVDAGGIAYDSTETYQSGTAGAALNDLNRQLSDVDENQIPELKNAIGQLGDIAAFKTAILQIAQKVAYIDEHGQDYYDDLYDALYPPAGLVSISAVYTQSGTVYDTDTLDSLKSDLVVTANYVDGSTATIPGADYTLSGTLVEGTSTITVSYGGKTDTFTVTVTNNTEAQIAQENYMLALRGGTVGPVSKQNAGITIKYELDSATTILHPAGVIVNDGLFGASDGCLAIYNNGAYVVYADENGRWGQAPAQSYTEYNSKSWTVQQYNQIEFSVDIRYLDDSYMYDYTSGKVFFAGKNTPYFGMSNISEAQ